MALATRCPNCHTTFRVVQDQLKLYAGIVRCGVCQQVFNGADHLVDADGPPPASAPEPQGAGQPAAAGIAPPPAETDALQDLPAGRAERTNDALPRDETSATPSPDAQAQEGGDGEFAPTELSIDEYVDLDILESQAAKEEAPAIALDLEDHVVEDTPTHFDLDVSPGSAAGREPAGPQPDEPTTETALPVWGDTLSRHEAEIGAEPVPETPADLPAFNQAALDAYLSIPEPERETEPEAAVPVDPMPAVVPAPAHAAAEPEFVRKARSRQKSRRASRVLLALASLLLLAALALQGIQAYSDRIVAGIPAAAPVVEQVCGLLGCETRLSAQIDELSLESTELQNLPDRPDAYVLDIVLRNRSSSPQAWPALELTLNDESGQPAVRRVLSPADYLDAERMAAVDTGIAAQSEQSVRLTFTLDQARAAGYRVYLFYP